MSKVFCKILVGFIILLYICINKTGIIPDTFKNAGWNVSNYDNRQKVIIQINKVAKLGILIEINKQGFVWKSKKTGAKGNIRIAGFGWTVRRHAGTLIEPIDVLAACAEFLQIKEVQEKINSEIQEPCTCGKCNGTGHIPAFNYYANGICFDCGGIGMTGTYTIKIK